MGTITPARDILARINKIRGKKEALQDQLKDYEGKYQNGSMRIEAIEGAAAVIQTVARQTQENLKTQIEDIVQVALDVCFPDEYTFVVKFETKRNRTETNMFLLSDGQEIDPMDAAGGGVVDVLSFALRIASWTLSRTENVVIIDEPFKFLSMNLKPLMGEVLQNLSKKLGIQFIMVTHDESMIDASDRVFTVSQTKGVSSVFCSQKSE